jgi:hypothetical protein
LDDHAADRHPDQARGGDLRRERVVRPLLRDVPVRGQHRRDRLSRQARSRRRARPGRC